MTKMSDIAKYRGNTHCSLMSGIFFYFYFYFNYRSFQTDIRRDSNA